MRRVRPVILAAGLSQRMGQPKAFLPWGDATLIEAVLASLAHPQLGQPIIVIRDIMQPDFDLLLGERACIVVNPDADSGMASSVLAGFGMFDAGDTHLLLALGDMPFVQPSTVDAILTLGAQHPEHAVVPTYQSKPGHPALLPRWLLEQDYLRTENARIDKLLDQFPTQVQLVAVDDSGILEDIDTPEQYRRARIRTDS